VQPIRGVGCLDRRPHHGDSHAADRMRSAGPPWETRAPPQHEPHPHDLSVKTEHYQLVSRTLFRWNSIRRGGALGGSAFERGGLCRRGVLGRDAGGEAVKTVSEFIAYAKANPGKINRKRIGQVRRAAAFATASDEVSRINSGGIEGRPSRAMPPDFRYCSTKGIFLRWWVQVCSPSWARRAKPGNLAPRYEGVGAPPARYQ
jgi:hypothetical protein